MQTATQVAPAGPAGAMAQRAGEKAKLQLKHPIGSIDQAAEDSLVCGWAWNETAPTRPTRLIIQVDGEHVAFVVPQEFRPDLVAAGIGHGCLAFSWRVPDAYRDAKPHEIRVIHAEFNQELPGSPRAVVLAPRGETLATGRAASPFVNPELSSWPNGVQGRAASHLAEIAPGLVVDAEEKCGAPQSLLLDYGRNKPAQHMVRMSCQRALYVANLRCDT